MLRVLAAIFIILFPASVLAECAGIDRLAHLSPEERAEYVGDAPYPTGLLWRATRGDTVIHLLGTLHVGDPRMTPMMTRLSPLIRKADLVLVEAGPEEEAQLKSRMAMNPEVMFITDGPTLPESLPEADWQELSAAMRARGIPPFLASKFQPWYVSMILAMPPCVMSDLTQGRKGLDHMVIASAQRALVPVRALEPYDTVLRLFELQSRDQQIDMIRAGLLQARDAEDMLATLRQAYFDEEIQQFWGFARAETIRMAGEDAKAAEEAFNLLEQELLIRRNLSWAPRIIGEAEGQNAIVAVGAAHLPGDFGVLKLLADEGFAIERQEF